MSDETLVAEELLLLLLDDESGKLRTGGFADAGTAVGGALLVELSLRGAIELTDKERFRSRRVVPTADRPELPPLLADALADIEEQERSASSLVSRLGKHRKDAVLDRLVEKGMVRRERDRVLGLFPRTRWPAEDERHEAEVRRRIDQALRAGGTADERTAALIALLSALDVVSSVVSLDEIGGRELKRRAKAIAEGDWASKAVHDAVAAVQAAVIAAIAAAGAASASG
ncbi:MAG: GPP34 family phosphoprotein [Actinomycetota bacterium]